MEGKVFSTNEAPPGHVFAVSGTLLEPKGMPILLPVYTRRLAIYENGKVIAEDAFVVTTVQHPEMVLLADAKQTLGNVVFESQGISFGCHAFESAMLMTAPEALAALDSVAKSPIAAIEEELTIMTMQAVHDRMVAVTAGTAAGAGAPPS